MAENENKDGVVVGGVYVENPDFVSDPRDDIGTFNTSGTGAHHDPATVSSVYAVDRNKTAADILAALDEDDDSVPSSRIILPEPVQVVSVDDDGAKEELRRLAQARVDQKVVIGGPSEAEAAAGKKGDEGDEAAALSAKDAAAESGAMIPETGGNHTGTVDTTGTSGRVTDATDVLTEEVLEATKEEGSTVIDETGHVVLDDSDEAKDADGDDADDAEDEGELKGAALDKALEDADLPKTGTADEKRARLAEAKAK